MSMTRAELERFVSEEFRSAAHWGKGWGDACHRAVEACLRFEREACARIADEVFFDKVHEEDPIDQGWADAANDLARAIRSRGQER